MQLSLLRACPEGNIVEAIWGLEHCQPMKENCQNKLLLVDFRFENLLYISVSDDDVVQKTIAVILSFCFSRKRLTVPDQSQHKKMGVRTRKTNMEQLNHCTK